MYAYSTLYRDQDVVAENLVIQHRDLLKFNHLSVKNILLLKNHPQVVIVLARFIIKMHLTLCMLLKILFITGALVSAGFEVSATVVKTKELDEAYVCPEDHKPDFNTGKTTAARYLYLQNLST